MHSSHYFMKAAYKEALLALKDDEVPIGAIIVKDDKIIEKAHNTKQTKNVATRHAEINAIEKACKKLHSWHLDGCSMYVTLEPCMMCVGACIQARIKDIYYGAISNQDGACKTKIDIDKIEGLNHYPNTIYYDGLPECSKIITNYFKSKR